MLGAIQSKAVEASIAVVTGAYHTALVSYFIHRDLLPSLIKVSANRFTFKGLC